MIDWRHRANKMARRSENRIETPHLTLVRATLRLLEAEQAYLVASQKWMEFSPQDRFRKTFPQEIPKLRGNFLALLGADGLADVTWPILGYQSWLESSDHFDSRDFTMLYL